MQIFHLHNKYDARWAGTFSTNVAQRFEGQSDSFRFSSAQCSVSVLHTMCARHPITFYNGLKSFIFQLKLELKVVHTFAFLCCRSPHDQLNVFSQMRRCMCAGALNGIVRIKITIRRLQRWLIFLSPNDFEQHRHFFFAAKGWLDGILSSYRKFYVTFCDIIKNGFKYIFSIEEKVGLNKNRYLIFFFGFLVQHILNEHTTMA